MAHAEHEKIYEVSAGKYFQAVADYSKYPEFIEGMKRVSVDRAADGTATATYDLTMMSKDMSYTLKLRENPGQGEVSWTLLKSDFFKMNNGAWKIEPLGPEKCRVKYSLEVDFKFPVPSFILKGIVKGTLPSMMDSFFKRAKQS